MGRSYLDRIVWQRSMELAEAVYDFTRGFPREELYALTNQLRRAAVSIPSNIAEGHGRNSPGQLVQFLCMARGSSYEVQTQLMLAARFSYGDRLKYELCSSLVDEVARMLNATIETLSKRQSEAVKGRDSHS